MGQITAGTLDGGRIAKMYQKGVTMFSKSRLVMPL